MGATGVRRILLGLLLVALAAVSTFLALLLVAYFGGDAFRDDSGSCHGGRNQGYFWAMLALGAAAGVSALATLACAVGRRPVRSLALLTCVLLAAQVILFFVTPDVRVELNFGQC